MEWVHYLWDESKSGLNLEKHGVGFEAAKLVFDDPLHRTRQDRIENGEQRWQTLGMAASAAVLLVAHTWEEDDSGVQQIRIISARRATKLERTIYEQGT